MPIIGNIITKQSMLITKKYNLYNNELYEAFSHSLIQTSLFDLIITGSM